MAICAGILARIQAHLLQVLLLLLSSAMLVLLAQAVTGRIAHPYCLEWMEGAMVDHVARVLDGKRLYVPPSLEFVPYIYSPMFYWASAAVAWVIGLGYLPLRIVSVAATAGTLVCIMAFVRRERGSWLAAIAGAALFAGTYPLSGHFIDLGRVDSLSICLLLWSAFAVRFGSGRSSVAIAAVLMLLAFFTKQSAAILAVPMAVYLFWASRRRCFWFVGLLAVLGVATNVAMDIVHDGWYWYYTNRVVDGHAKIWKTIHLVVRNDLAMPFCFAIAVSALVFLRRASAGGRSHGRLFYGMLFAGLALTAVMGRVHSGGYMNVLMPWHAGIAVLFGVGIHAAHARNGHEPSRLRHYAVLLASIQLALLWWDPTHSIPAPGDIAAGDAWVAKIKAVPGRVWVTHRSHMGVLAGKEPHAHMMAMLDVMRSEAEYRKSKSKLGKEVDEALSTQRFELVITDNYDFWFLPTLRRFYDRDGVDWFDGNRDAFWARSGARLRPELGHKPRQSGARPR